MPWKSSVPLKMTTVNYVYSSPCLASQTMLSSRQEFSYGSSYLDLKRKKKIVVCTIISFFLFTYVRDSPEHFPAN